VTQWLRFNLVGVIGAAVQLAMLSVLANMGWNLYAATAVAVEVALLHNYVWHVRWTWRDRRPSLWRFHLANGLTSLVANLLWMRLLHGLFGLPTIAANLLGIVLTSVINYSVGNRWVFKQRPARDDTHALSASRLR
jgi:putative flippase GtrA